MRQSNYNILFKVIDARNTRTGTDRNTCTNTDRNTPKETKTLQYTETYTKTEAHISNLYLVLLSHTTYFSPYIWMLTRTANIGTMANSFFTFEMVQQRKAFNGKESGDVSVDGEQHDSPQRPKGQRR